MKTVVNCFSLVSSSRREGGCTADATTCMQGCKAHTSCPLWQLRPLMPPCLGLTISVLQAAWHIRLHSNNLPLTCAVSCTLDR